MKHVLWTVGLGLVGCHVEVKASEGSCLLEQCDRKQDIIATIHPTEQNVLKTPLQSCSTEPLTGFYRDGYCRTGSNDRGIHVVCAEMTEEFLVYTKSKGNDLSSPSPQYGFPGLKPGDRWCLCAARWAEAHEVKVAPKVVLEATSEATLRHITLPTLQDNIAK